ncbi:hypothetical protein [Aeromicrobium fastidiosum]|uniref:Uncharacterized protein n=1 Tax=Aeromicrobium fastidiosum TaxID=52699 RepID=A0A641AMY5_9ACTN|nr:hypothetical protein [Aeromicrobium fastidiosum]KAA1378226.1 hypothetical protein ESP62_007550 [Aeromicrobium fastidiosum]MBP2388963.1 hypothetical protein [Aeromicrobium fastidiosum]
MTSPARRAALPLAAVALVAGTIGVQLGHGGGTYEPLRPADACIERPVTSQVDGIEGLTERLVLIGIDDAACTLGTSREALTLRIAQADEPTAAEIGALRRGLLSAVRRMKADGTLPPASDLVDEVLGSADLNPLLERVVRALPDSAINAALKTDDVLRRTIEGLDLRRLLRDVDDVSAIDEQIEPAVTQAVKDSLEARVRDLV